MEPGEEERYSNGEGERGGRSKNARIPHISGRIKMIWQKEGGGIHLLTRPVTVM